MAPKAAAHGANDQQKDEGAHERLDDLRYQSDAKADTEGSEDPPAEEGADHTNDHVDEEAVPAPTDGGAGQDPRDQSNQDEDQGVRTAEIDCRQRDGHSSLPPTYRVTDKLAITLAPLQAGVKHRRRRMQGRAPNARE